MAQHLNDLAGLGIKASERARHWLERSKDYPTDRAAQLLAETLRDPSGLDFTVSFVDGVIRPEDQKVAAERVGKLAGAGPAFLPNYLRLPLKLGGKAAQVLPGVVVPAATKVFQQLVGDLVLNAKGKGLEKSIARLKESGARLNINLLGEAVLGNKEASKRLSDTSKLLERDDVDYVSMKVSSVIGPHDPWAYDEAVENAVDALLPLYAKAASYEPKKFINLDMEEYHDLHLTIDVFKAILDRPEFLDLRAGIVLQAYLPDALPAMQDLQAWSATRVARGGTPIKVRVVKGANLSMERVNAITHGWPMVTEPSKEHTDANYIRVLDYALRPQHTRNVNIGVAGMNLFTVAFGYELAKDRNCLDGVEFEMLAGMAAPQAAAVTDDVGPLLYYVPVVNPEEYDVAIAYLVRRLEENALPANFMSSIFEYTSSPDLVDREQQRFTAALAHAFSDPVGPNRTQNRQTETESDLAALVSDDGGSWTFENTPDSDPSLPANVEWARQIAARMKDSTLGADVIAEARVDSAEQLDELASRAAAAGQEWAERSAADRSDIIHRVGVALAKNRAALIEVAGSEAGKALDQGDVEVSEAVDFAHYYAEQALELGKLAGAKYVPSRVVVVTPPWNFPMAIPAGGMLAGLASGAAVVFKPAPEARRTGAMLAKIMWDAGIPRDVLHLVDISEGDLGKQLIANPLVDRVILTGSIETAQLFKSWRPDLGLLAETSGKDSIIVTPHADLDLAVKDIVTSAFSHAGQKCSACSTVILVGSVAYSRRFRDQLLDAVTSLQVGWPWELGTEMGPLVTPASGKLLRGLTILGPGETWAIKPKPLDDSGKLWGPGVRAGVAEGSEYHGTEYFGPILGVMTAKTLDDAIRLQNYPDYGLTAGLHSLNADEINHWLERVEAGNVYVNRGITGAIVRRQPFGGWKRSAVGAGTKAGGPSYLYGLGRFERDDSVVSEAADVDVQTLSSISEHALAAADALGADAALVKALLVSAEHFQDTEFGIGHDPSQLGVERNVLRYSSDLNVLLRLSDGEPVWKLLALAATGLIAGSEFAVSAPAGLVPEVQAFLTAYDVDLRLESDAEFRAGLGEWAQRERYYNRIRLIGGDLAEVVRALPVDKIVDVPIYNNDVTLSGRVEILPFVIEQAVSMTNHRFGNPTPLSAEVRI